MTRQRIVIVGAGPAGLTAAYELARAGRTDVVVLEATGDIGGLSKTVQFKGNRIDIGGHRFFSKSDWVMQWWLDVLPLEHSVGFDSVQLTFQGKQRTLDGALQDTASATGAMLLRRRLSRILFDGKFFDYPLKLDVATALKLGIWKCVTFGTSYLRAALFPRRPERTLEDFFVNRFGKRLYLQFFKEYTEKVWGTACSEISAEWGAQRVKSLSVATALRHAVARLVGRGSAGQATTDQTSLIEQFLYPKLGPGQMWEAVAQRIQTLGVRIEMDSTVVRLECEQGRISAVHIRRSDGAESRIEAAAVVSTMPVRDLVRGLGEAAPARIRDVAEGLQYRDFVTVGLLYRRMSSRHSGLRGRNIVPDNWIYVQEPGVKVGRLQFFNNWSPYMVEDPHTVWIGMEYFCREGDEIWCAADQDLLALGVREMDLLGLAERSEWLDGVVVRMPKAYPGYYGAYAHFDEVKTFLDAIPNLFLVGRNGMHRYNNQDHSMLSARLAVEAILSGSNDKSAIWNVNIDDDYHEGGAANPIARSASEPGSVRGR